MALNTRMKVPGNAADGRLRYEFDKRSINVVGIGVAGRWLIWAHKLVKNAPAPKILSLNRIWPL